MRYDSSQTIERGTITLQGDQAEREYEIRILGRDDVDDVARLQYEVLSLMEKKEFCVPIDRDELELMMGTDGESVGMFIGGRLYAMCSLLFNVKHENSMAKELAFDDDKIRQSAQLELSLVDSRLRGHNLQMKLAGILADRLKESKRSRYLFTTVSPYNYPSIKTVTSLGLRIAKLCKLYWSWDRYVVYRDFCGQPELDRNDCIVIPSTDTESQQRLLEQGYFGFSQMVDEGIIKIVFSKPLQSGGAE